MGTVFISHSSKDDVWVDKLIADLEKHGIQTWVDHHQIKLTHRWNQEVHKALSACNQLIAIISEDSIDSENCQNEWYFFIGKKKEVLPVWLKGPEMYFQFSTTQWADFRTDYDAGLKKLIHYLTDNITNVPAEPPKDPKTSKPLLARLDDRYPLARAHKKYIGIATGNIAEIAGVDVLVNTENTHLEMDSIHGESVSGTINKFGAKRNEKGEIIENTIEIYLQHARQSSNPMQLGTVLATRPGSLENQGIRQIVHAVTVARTAPGQFQPGSNIQLGRCVMKVLETIDKLNIESYGHQDTTPLKTVVFPIFAAGKGGRKISEVAQTLVERAIDYLETHQTHIEAVYFVAYREKDYTEMQKVFAAIPDLTAPIHPSYES